MQRQHKDLGAQVVQMVGGEGIHADSDGKEVAAVAHVPAPPPPPIPVAVVWGIGLGCKHRRGHGAAASGAAAAGPGAAAVDGSRGGKHYARWAAIGKFLPRQTFQFTGQPGPT